MASEKILEAKKQVVSEIVDKIKNSESVILFQYQGLTVADMAELRRSLKNIDSEVKVYKNTLTKRAVDETDYDLASYLEGPTAISFSTDELAPVKIISEFAKSHEALEVKAGIVEGKVAKINELNEYAKIPSREGLLTMLAGGMIATVRDLSICLDLYSKEKEETK